MSAACCRFYFRDEVLPYYAGDTTAARDLAANDFKYWELMRRACERGLRVFDYGRSKRGTGSFDFKKNWGFEPQPLHYEYRLLQARRDAAEQSAQSEVPGVRSRCGGACRVPVVERARSDDRAQPRLMKRDLDAVDRASRDAAAAGAALRSPAASALRCWRSVGDPRACYWRHGGVDRRDLDALGDVRARLRRHPDLPVARLAQARRARGDARRSLVAGRRARRRCAGALWLVASRRRRAGRRSSSRSPSCCRRRSSRSSGLRDRARARVSRSRSCCSPCRSASSSCRR